jgi:16S rRNA (cytosine1402-N4)-methyltransferase
LAILDKRKLTFVFSEVLPEYISNVLADSIIKKRSQKQILTTGDFLEVIKPLMRKKGKIDSATLPFLALRIAVNSELENLKIGLEKAYQILLPGGRIAVISFHSGEDRIVKNFFRRMETENKGLSLSKKPTVPDKEEIAENPRSRSAKLRVFEKNET